VPLPAACTFPPPTPQREPPYLHAEKLSREGHPTPHPFKLLTMPPAVSQVSRSTKTRLRFLRRLVLLVVFLVLLAIALSQFTELKRLATGILASTAVLAAIIGFAAQHTIGNMVAGVQLAISQPIKIGDRISFEEISGRVTDITLSYTYVNPGDGTSVVIPNQMLVDGVVHNLSTEDTQA
jgi:small-conductance mechanosensitive channel